MSVIFLLFAGPHLIQEKQPWSTNRLRGMTLRKMGTESLGTLVTSGATSWVVQLAIGLSSYPIQCTILVECRTIYDLGNKMPSAKNQLIGM